MSDLVGKSESPHKSESVFRVYLQFFSLADFRTYADFPT